jgi:multidrug efflux pump subunit AcrA (membrane-fusion protein)
VTVAAAAVKSVTPAGTFVGRVQAVNTVNLVSRVEGFLQKRAFTEGQQVKTGDLLFVIEQDTYQAAVDQAQAQLASAQATERNAAIALQSPKNWSRPSGCAGDGRSESGESRHGGGGRAWRPSRS